MRLVWAKSQFGVEEVAVGVQGVEQCIDSAPVPHVGETRPVLECRYQQFLFGANFSHLAILNERVGNFTEGSLNHSFILDQGDLLLGPGQSHIRFDSTGGKDGLRQLGRKLPYFSSDS